MERLTTRPQGELIKCMECCDYMDCDAVGCGNINDAIMKLKHYEDLEEQGLLLKLPISIENAVDKLFSHNEIISLWKEARENGISVHKRIWYGMAWDIPEELKNCKFVKIFGTIPESIAHADIINIEVLLSEEAEKAV